MSQNKSSFILLVISQGISLIGTSLLRFAISLHVLDLTGSAEIFATMIAVSFLPMLLFMPLGGAIADRFSKKMILVISDSANTLLVGALAVLLFGGSESIILLGATITLLTLISSCYHPTVTASLPAILQPEELAGANGIVQGMKAVSSLAGPIMAGFLFGAIGVNNLVALCAIFFLLSSVINIFIKIPYSPRERQAGVVHAIAADMKEGFVYITKENTIFLKTAVILALVVFFHQPMLSIAFPYTIRITFGMSEELFGFANAAIGAAMLTGSLLAGRLKRYMQIRHLAYYIAIIGIATVPIAIIMIMPSQNSILPFLLLVANFMFIMIAFTLVNILITTYTQANAPKHIVGKAIAIFISIANLSVPIGQFVMGSLIENLTDAQFVLYLAIAALTVLLGVASKRFLTN